jgi:hypothetical protein
MATSGFSKNFQDNAATANVAVNAKIKAVMYET